MSEDDKKDNPTDEDLSYQTMREANIRLSEVGLRSASAGSNLRRAVGRASMSFNQFYESTRYLTPFDDLYAPSEFTFTSSTLDLTSKINTEKNDLEDFCDRTSVDFRTALTAFTSISETLRCRRDNLIKDAKETIIRHSRFKVPSALARQDNTQFWAVNPYAIIYSGSDIGYLGSIILDQSVLDREEDGHFYLKVKSKTPERPKVRVIRTDNLKIEQEKFTLVPFERYLVDFWAHVKPWGKLTILILQPLEPVHLEEGKLFLRG